MSLLQPSALPWFLGSSHKRRGDGREASARRTALGVGEKETTVAKKKREHVFGKRKRGLFETELKDGCVEPIETK